MDVRRRQADISQPPEFRYLRTYAGQRSTGAGEQRRREVAKSVLYMALFRAKIRKTRTQENTCRSIATLWPLLTATISLEMILCENRLSINFIPPSHGSRKYKN